MSIVTKHYTKQNDIVFHETMSDENPIAKILRMVCAAISSCLILNSKSECTSYYRPSFVKYMVSLIHFRDNLFFMHRLPNVNTYNRSKSYKCMQDFQHIHQHALLKSMFYTKSNKGNHIQCSTVFDHTVFGSINLAPSLCCGATC